MKPSEILLAAKEKINTPEKWTQGELAKNARGEKVPRYSETAVCWCSLGAICAVAESETAKVESRAESSLRQVVIQRIDIWNDDPERTHEEVMNAFDKAIALAQKEGA